MKIYLIDDDPNILNILKIIIQTRNLGEICGLCGSPVDAMEDLKYCKPDIVIIDLLMPGMDGIQVLEEMQRRELLDDIPVIMITADTSADSMSHAYELGVADYIERPFDVQVVRRRVMNTVKLYARQRRLRGFTG